MQIYKFRDPDTGQILKLRGDSEPTEQDIQAGFDQMYAEQMQGVDPDVPTPENLAMDSAQQPELPETSVADDIIGAGETALSTVTGATTGAVGFGLGAVSELVQQAIEGKIGTQEAVKAIEDQALKYSQALTYQPRTQAGQQQAQAVGEVLEETLGQLPPTALSGAIPAANLVRQAVRATPAPRMPVTVEQPRQGSVGAMQTTPASQRQMTGESLPVPFKGESGLTTGQATRDFAQLQFEKETAKRGDVGQPLRERVENQTRTLFENFDAMVEDFNPSVLEDRDLGFNIDKAIVNKSKLAKKQIAAQYKKAEEQGEMRQPIVLDNIRGLIDELTDIEDVAKNAVSIKKYMDKRGIIDEDGNPQQITLSEIEKLRKFTNKVTNLDDPQQSLVRRLTFDFIDNATENAGGDVYKKARKMRTDYAKEFENVGITNRLLTNKRGTDERKIAFEDVFKKIVLDSPIEEINKLRATLLKSGDDGKQSWTDLKAKTINYIKENSSSESQRDSQGNLNLSPDKLTKTVNNLDRKGKLDSLFGKKQAQELRDLAELAQVIYTAPAGAVNASGTASALQVALDGLATFGLSGVPLPIATSLQQASKFVKNKALQKRINKALKGEIND